MAHDFVLHTRFGVVVARPVEALDKDALLARLPAAEAGLATSWGVLRVRTFVAGRLALRAALRAAGVDEDDVAAPILHTPRGAPALAVSRALRVSVSHKDTVAVALAADAAAESTGHVGVDIELFPGPKDDLSAHVLTESERAELAALDAEARRRELLTRFSLKEALYKALDPFVQRYVGFLEVEARPDAAGGAAFALALKHGEGPFVVEGEHRAVDGGVLTLARVSRP